MTILSQSPGIMQVIIFRRNEKKSHLNHHETVDFSFLAFINPAKKKSPSVKIIIRKIFRICNILSQAIDLIT